MFSIKGLGSIHFFLGVVAIPTTQGLFLCQHKYTRDLLDHTNMVDGKIIHSPMSTSTPLTQYDGARVTNTIEYRSIVEALQYMSMTRPNITYTKNKLADAFHNLKKTFLVSQSYHFSWTSFKEFVFSNSLH